MGHSLTDHALSCDICTKWVISADFGNNPPCREGQEIREEIRTNRETSR